MKDSRPNSPRFRFLCAYIQATDVFLSSIVRACVMAVQCETDLTCTEDDRRDRDARSGWGVFTEMFASHPNVPHGRISFQMQQERKQARIQADFHPHLSLEKQYCCKRERRVRRINMRRNNLIYWPTATNYHQPGKQHKFQEGVGHTRWQKPL